MAQAQLDPVYNNQEAFLVNTTAPIEARRALVRKGDSILIDRIFNSIKQSKNAREHPRLQRNLKKAVALRLFDKSLPEGGKKVTANEKAKLLKRKRQFLAAKPRLDYLVPVRFT